MLRLMLRLMLGLMLGRMLGRMLLLFRSERHLSQQAAFLRSPSSPHGVRVAALRCAGTRQRTEASHEATHAAEAAAAAAAEVAH